MKNKKDPRVDVYFKAAPPFARPILKHLRKLVHESCPLVEETLKWDAPWFMYEGKVLCGLVTFKAHLAFLFNKRSRIGDERAQKDLQLIRKVKAMDDLPSATVLKAYVKAAMKLNEPGASPVKRKVKPAKPPAKIPADLSRAMAANPKSRAAYKLMSESVRRHYIEWITEAKTPGTRSDRVAKSVQCIAAGKAKHWK